MISHTASNLKEVSIIMKSDDFDYAYNLLSDWSRISLHLPTTPSHKFSQRAAGM